MTYTSCEKSLENFVCFFNEAKPPLVIGSAVSGVVFVIVADVVIVVCIRQ